MRMTDAKYTELCNKYFAPLDEIAEALESFEGMLGMTNSGLEIFCSNNPELVSDLKIYHGINL